MMEIRAGSPPEWAMEPPYRMTIADHEGRLMGVVTSGGHPTVEPDQVCIVLDCEVADTQQELLDWFDTVQVTQPWRRRN